MFLKDFAFLSMYMFVFLVCHIYGCARRCQKRMLDPLELVVQVVVSYQMVLGTELGTLEEQQMLLTTEPCLQLLCTLTSH